MQSVGVLEFGVAKRKRVWPHRQRNGPRGGLRTSTRNKQRPSIAQTPGSNSCSLMQMCGEVAECSRNRRFVAVSTGMCRRTFHAPAFVHSVLSLEDIYNSGVAQQAEYLVCLVQAEGRLGRSCAPAGPFAGFRALGSPSTLRLSGQQRHTFCLRCHVWTRGRCAACLS